MMQVRDAESTLAASGTQHDRQFILSWIRSQFPALSRMFEGQPVVFFDGPAGTQVPQSVADAVSRYLLESNANHGGVFATSRQSDEILAQAHRAVADLLGCQDESEIVFGQNMTSLTFALSRSLAKTWSPGDEIIVTRLDHDANITPWVLAAQDAGALVRWWDFDRSDATLDLDQLRRLLSDRTRLVAVGCASNATGGTNPVGEICELARRRGALVFLDAVHWAPHGPIDVGRWDCDFLACSSYKFFGPHLGILWGRRELLQQLPAYKVRPADPQPPGKWMTGTQSHEAIAGAMAAIDYLADLGRQLRLEHRDMPRPAALATAFQWIVEYEQFLSRRLLQGLANISHITAYGITDVDRLHLRVPTFSIRSDRESPWELATRLDRAGIFVWHGNYYALEFSQQMGFEPEGMVRIGMLHYNETQEIDRLLECLA